jgi:DNA mismatch endonuclease (patch repair protein)
MPHSNEQYWNAKIARNVERDARTNASYQDSEWRLMRFWEHDLREDFQRCIDDIEAAVQRVQS